MQNYSQPPLIFYNLSQPIIEIFAKILDIDYIYNYEEINNNHQSWNEDFSNTPIKKIEINNCPTIVLNSIGKVYSLGWTNFGQIGVFPNLTKQSYVVPYIIRKNNEKFPSKLIKN